MEYTTNLIVCEVESYDDKNENGTLTEYTLCSAPSMAECVQELESFYGDDIISVKMIPLEPGPIIVSKHIADLFAEGDPSEA